MFYLHISNKTEILVKKLIEIKDKSVKDNIFEKEIFIIQDDGVGRWLAQQLTFNQTLFANFEFISLPKFFAQLLNILEIQLSDSSFDISILTWKIHSIFSQNSFSKFKILSRYFENDHCGLYRFQLSQQLAKIFKQYQKIRPEILTAWENDEAMFSDNSFHQTEQWQKYIWNLLSEQMNEDISSCFELRERTIDGIQCLQKDEVERLPNSISIFGVRALNEFELQFIKAVSKYIDVHFYLFSATKSYWVGQELQLMNPILRNFGQQGKHFAEMISLGNKYVDEKFNYFKTIENDSILHVIQNDVLHNTIPFRDKHINSDGSIIIHNCHTEVRELEVLKNEILEAVNTSDLSLREIIVMSPDIEKYVPYITAIFSDVKHHISDENLRNNNLLIGIFERFISVVTGRFGWQEVLDLLSTPEVYKSFGLSELDLQYIHHWVAETNVRWAYSAEQKIKLGLPADEVNTWQMGIEQMFYGYAVGDEQKFVDGFFPYSEIEGGSVIILGALYEYLKLLFSANKDFSSAHTLSGWSKIFGFYVNTLFNNDSINTKQKFELIGMIRQLNDADLDFYSLEVKFSVIHNWLQNENTNISSTHNFLSGGLTFCSMNAKRTLPFRMIALLGMNEGDFPRRDYQVTFDLTKAEVRKHDPSILLEGKNQFLEILLSAQDKLLIFYQGQLAENNAPLQPASVVSDLIDVMTGYYALDTNHFVIKHALQAYHYRYFNEMNQHFYSYDAFHLNIAQQQFKNQLISQKSIRGASSWWPSSSKIEFTFSKVIEMRDLISFVKHPQAYFVEQVLQIKLNSEVLLSQETEPFIFTTLEKYLLNDELVTSISNVSEEINLVQEKIYQVFKEKGKLLGGKIGRLDFNNKFHHALKYKHKFLEIEEVIGEKSEDIIFDFNLILECNQEYQLIGTLSNQFEHAMVLYRFGELKGKTLTETWIKHLLLNQVTSKVTYLIYGQEEVRVLKFLPKDKNLSPLTKWVNLFLLGQEKPSCFLPESALVYVSKSSLSRSKKSSVEKANDKFQKQLLSEFEPELNLLYQQLSAEEKNALFNDDFQMICHDLLEPIVEVLGL